MKNIITILLCCIQFQLFAQANKEDAKQFVALSGVDRRYDELINRVITQVKSSKQEEFKKDLVYFKNKMIAEMVNFYAAQFSDAEIKSLITFYKTPLGRKLVEANSKYAIHYQKREQEFQREVGRLIMKYMY